MPQSASNGPSDPETVDELFGSLASERRRRVLAFLRTTADGTADIETVAEALGADTTEADEAAVVNHLHHAVLPKLDATGLVVFDPVSGRVEYRGHPLLEPLLDLATELEAPS